VTYSDPNPDTDFVRSFKPAAYIGADFAAISRFRQIHSRLDKLDVINTRSLQEYGNQVHQLVRYFGNVDLAGSSEHNRVFFPVLNTWVVHYSGQVAIALLLVSVILSAIAVGVGVFRHVVTIGGVLVTCLAVVFGCGVGVIAEFAIWSLISNIHPMYQHLFNGVEYNNSLFFVGFSCIAAAFAILVFRLVRNKLKIRITDVAAGVMILAVTAAVVFSNLAFEIGYLPTWISLANAIATIYLVATFDTSTGEVSGRQLFILILAAIVPFVLIVPILGLSFASSPEDLARYLPVVVIVASLTPLLCAVSTRGIMITSSLFGLVAFSTIAVAITDQFSAKLPRVTQVSMLQDAESGKSFWVTEILYPSGPDSYSAQFLTSGQQMESVRNYVPGFPYDYESFITPIDIDGIFPPDVNVLEDSTESGIRTIRFHISSNRNAHEISIFKNSDLEVLDWSVNGVKSQPVFGLAPAESGDRFLFNFRNIPPSGLDIRMTVRVGPVLEITILETSYGLPNVPGISTMGDDMIPWLDYGAHKTTVKTIFRPPGDILGSE
jgi:hypothetical protein